MPGFRRKNVEVIEPVEVERTEHSLIASAMKYRFDDASYNNYRFRDETWQRELWRLYDITPELRFSANWVGSACSRVDIYVAEVDKLGRVQGRAKKKEIAALSDTIFGGPVARAEAIRAGAINLTVAGEFYILGTTAKDSDKWFVLSSSEIRRTKQGDIFWGDKKYYEEIVDLAKSMVTRVWTPHPQRIWCADSPARSCQAILRELEQLTKYVFSQIDSRLAGAGMLVIPNNLDFPAEDGISTAGESLMMRLATAMAASLKGEGTATALVPLILEADPEDIERSFKLISFASELSKQAMELRTEAIRRLAGGMDIAQEILTGQGDMNHWSSWFVDEATVKMHVEPLMNRICDALTVAYLEPALKAMKEDPKKYVYTFDTSPLTIRPQRLQDALNLYEKGAIGYEALRVAGYFKESDAPSNEESVKKFLMELMLRDPNLFMQAGLRELIGITPEMLPPEALTAPVPGGPGGAGPPPPPAPPLGIQNPGVSPTPDNLGAPPMSIGGGMPAAGAPQGGGGLQAAAVPFGSDQVGVLVASNAAVLRALEIAGGKLLDRTHRGMHPHTPRHEMHTQVRARDTLHAASLLEGAWTHLPTLANQYSEGVDIAALRATLTHYCTTLLTEGIPHESRNLLPMLINDGHLDGRLS
jgi:hypothetical protein